MSDIRRTVDDDIADFCMKYQHKPSRFVRAVYPWGEKGTDLEDETGPDVWQDEVMQCIEEYYSSGKYKTESLRIAISSGHGSGKAEMTSTYVDTPNGKRMFGDLRAGDRVFGSDGQPVKIVATYPQGVIPIYRVSFDDGSFSMVSADHLWAVRGRAERRYGLKPFVVMTTQEILDRGVLRSNGVAMTKQWEVPVQGPVAFDGRTTAAHPYLMGVWLGDGHRGKSRYSKPDVEIIEHLNAVGHRVSGAGGDNEHTFLGIASEFCQQDVVQCYSYERYIPAEYKYNSIDLRWELLRGLLDTDGECDKGNHVIYNTTSERLADDVIWLVRSLGGKAMLQPTVKRGRYRNGEGEIVECRDCYRVTINFPGKPTLFYIARKQNNLTESEDRYCKRWISSIEYSHDAEAMCIRVDAGDSLYQTKDFIVTHNSTQSGWLTHWGCSCFKAPRIVVTANTQSQLDTKTWREVAKWQKLALNGHWFQWTATKYYLKGQQEDWYASAIPWNEQKPEAFAGTHETKSLTLFQFDEASAIPDPIWESSEGAFTDPNSIWVVYGNPTRNTGRFRECFGREKHRWHTWQLDSRQCKMSSRNLAQIKAWEEDYGEDSDFFRVRVKGMFPRAGSMQFISVEAVTEAQKRNYSLEEIAYSPIAIGCDVARFGDDQTVILVRRGLKVVHIEKYRGLDTMQVASLLAQAENRWRADIVFVDEGGLGAGVVDRGRQLGHRWVGVNNATRAVNGKKYSNKRAETWGEMRDWLATGDIPADDKELEMDLTGPEYGFNNREQIQLEKKDDMKRRGLSSPDVADALALTFAERLGARFESDGSDDLVYLQSRKEPDSTTGY